MNNEKIKFSLRIDKETYDIIKKVAENNNRSINNQIDFILKSFIGKIDEVRKLTET